MKQKLIAVAVAGAFAAPAVAFAQASTVNIYGYVNAEYGFASSATKGNGAGLPSYDALNSPASYIGFKGEEKLSGGMSAWFQCETDAGFLKGDSKVTASTNTTAGAATAGHVSTQGGWCSRNSALGLKGGFGNFFLGHWDSPTKRAVAAHRVVGETGWQGVQGMLISNGGTFTGTFSARNSNSINYESPRFSGFSANVQTTSTAEQANTVGAPNVGGRSNSFSVNYGAGPLSASVAYTALDNNRAASGVVGAKDTAFVLGGSYTFGAARIGLLYIDADAQPAVGTTLTRKSYNIAGTYRLGGPHSLKGGYTVAGDTKSNLGTATTGFGANSGASEYQIGYFNALSKRTNAGVIYMYAKNDDRATGYSVGNNKTTGMAAGESTSAIVLTVNHTF
jgi:predicted porin